MDEPNVTPDWRASFGDDATTALASFQQPGDFYKQYQTVATELDTLKKSQPTYDWRKEISGGDEKAAKTFERFSTIQDAGKAYLEAVTKIRSGELAKPLPKDATPDQVAEWRKGNDIPDSPAGYFEKLPNGLVIGEEDKPLFDGFAKAMHDLNAPPAMIHAAVEWYYGMQDEQVQAQQGADGERKTKLESELRTAWGQDFQANANIYMGYIDSAPAEVKEALTTARDIDGNYILYRPEVVAWLTAQARELNPTGHILPGGSGGDLSSVQTEIDGIEKLMRTNRSEYNRDEAKQARLRQLYTAREKLKARGAA